MKKYKMRPMVVVAIAALLILVLLDLICALFDDQIYEWKRQNSSKTLTTVKAEDQAEYEAAYGAVSISAAQDSYHTDEDKFYFALSNGTDYSLFYGGKEF